MAKYVDGFVAPIQKKNVAAYRKMANKGRKIWMEHGALAYVECIGEDLEVKMVLPFPKGIKSKPGETIIFSYIVFKSRAHRDAVNKKVMADPRMNMDETKMPFDFKRMMYGGFDVIVEG